MDAFTAALGTYVAIAQNKSLLDLTPEDRNAAIATLSGGLAAMLSAQPLTKCSGCDGCPFGCTNVPAIEGTVRDG